MFQILVGYASKIGADKVVLEVAKQHAIAFKAKVHVASSMEGVSEKNKTEFEELEKQLAYIKETIEKDGVTCETHILVRGVTPGEDLVELAKDRKIDEIIIGIEKKSKVGKFLFGSNAQYVILEAPCPVVCVK